MIDRDFLHALTRVSSFSIAEIGDACKSDLVLIATKGGMTEEEIHEKFPEFYESTDDSFVAESPSEEEIEENQQEEEETNQ